MTINEPIAQHITSTEFAYQSIHGLIVSGKFTPGQRLIYADLERILGISKTPIVSALSRLEHQGFVDYIKNRGYSVTRNDLNLLFQDVHLQSLADRAETDDEGKVTLPPEDSFAPTSLNSIIYEKIKELIRTQEFTPGQKLVYSDLERKLGVSKTPIINALSKLESEGYVYIKKNVGCYVKESQPDEIDEVMEARTCLEVSNIDFVMQHLNQDDVGPSWKNFSDAIAPIKPTNLIGKNSLPIPNSMFAWPRLAETRFMVRYIENIYEWLEFTVRLDILPCRQSHPIGK